MHDSREIPPHYFEIALYFIFRADECEVMILSKTSVKAKADILLMLNKKKTTFDIQFFPISFFILIIIRSIGSC